jgi:hypothetical protein
MKLPKTFKTGQKKYTVEMVDALARGCRGRVVYDHAKVYVAKRGLWCAHTQEQMHETLIHEMVHAVLHEMGDDYNKEKFVEPFAKKLSQTILSARF